MSLPTINGCRVYTHEEPQAAVVDTHPFVVLFRCIAVAVLASKMMCWVLRISCDTFSVGRFNHRLLRMQA